VWTDRRRTAAGRQQGREGRYNFPASKYWVTCDIHGHGGTRRHDRRRAGTLRRDRRRPCTSRRDRSHPCMPRRSKRRRSRPPDTPHWVGSARRDRGESPRRILPRRVLHLRSLLEGAIVKKLWLQTQSEQQRKQRWRLLCRVSCARLIPPDKNSKPESQFSSLHP
jgi:hypothetical protein